MTTYPKRRSNWRRNMSDAYTMPLDQLKTIALGYGIDPDKFKEATLRRMVATRLRRAARRG